MAEVRKNEEKSRYEILDGGQVAGFAEYEDGGDAVTLPHTEVEKGHEGAGLGGQLAKFALDDVKASGKAVLPTCPFIASYIQRHPEYRDLVPQDRRSEFEL